MESFSPATRQTGSTSSFWKRAPSARSSRAKKCEYQDCYRPEFFIPTFTMQQLTKTQRLIDRCSLINDPNVDKLLDRLDAYK